MPIVFYKSIEVSWRMTREDMDLISTQSTETVPENLSNSTRGDKEVIPPILYDEATPLVKILVSIVISIISLVTVVGNLMVMASFRLEKQLHTITNYFLFSLSVADFCIGLFSIPLCTLYILMGRWTLGPIICNLWLSEDYTASGASVWNLLVISFDRYFSVTRPLTYRVRRTKTKAFVAIAVAWTIATLLNTPWIWLWPVFDPVDQLPADQCIIMYLETSVFMTIFTNIISFFLPIAVMFFLYHKVYRVTEDRKKELVTLQSTIVRTTEDKLPASAAASKAAETNGTIPTESQYCGLCWRKTKRDEVSEVEKNLADDDPVSSFKEQTIGVANEACELSPESIISTITLDDAHNCHATQSPPSVMTASNNVTKSRKIKSTLGRHSIQAMKDKKQEQKAAKTLSAILLAFFVTWAPYNVFAVLNAACNGCVTDKVPQLYYFGYFLCYINSTVNPVCYALCNATFRKTFYRILSCRFTKR